MILVLSEFEMITRQRKCVALANVVILGVDDDEVAFLIYRPNSSVSKIVVEQNCC